MEDKSGCVFESGSCQITCKNGETVKHERAFIWNQNGHVQVRVLLKLTNLSLSCFFFNPLTWNNNPSLANIMQGPGDLMLRRNTYNACQSWSLQCDGGRGRNMKMTQFNA